jgi:hypothetical protein
MSLSHLFACSSFFFSFPALRYHDHHDSKSRNDAVPAAERRFWDFRREAQQTPSSGQAGKVAVLDNSKQLCRRIVDWGDGPAQAEASGDRGDSILYAYTLISECPQIAPMATGYHGL